MQIIVNVTPEWGIGSENRLLVHIRADMRRFRSLTTDHTIVIGRKTLATFPNGNPLPNRENIILTHDAGFTAEGAVICHDLNELGSILRDRKPDSVFVCGGEQIYRLLLPYCSRAIVTLTYSYEKADRFFPNLNVLPNWVLTETGEMQEENGTFFRYLTYENTTPSELP